MAENIRMDSHKLIYHPDSLVKDTILQDENFMSKKRLA